MLGRANAERLRRRRGPDSAVTSAGTANLIVVGSTDLVRPDPPRERRLGTPCQRRVGTT